jgi:hypothetical protein
MVSNSSVWLRETARLYLRYMAVGLIGVPLTLLYAAARRADWNMTIVTVGLLVLGFVGGLLLWRRLGDWQVKTADPSFDAWVDLVNATIQTPVSRQQTAVCLQQFEHIHDEDLQSWHDLVVPHAASLNDVNAELNNLLAQQAIANEQQQQYRQSVTRRWASTQSNGTNVRLERTRQRQPAWAMALGGYTQNAHGLA